MPATPASKSATSTPKKTTSGKKLDLGAGQNCTPGFESVDINGSPDHRVNLFAFPWPFEDRSVKEIVSNHLVEHIPHYRPEYEGRDGWDMFWSEVYRICRKNAKLTITHPYVKNDRAFWDPTHTRFIHETTWYYLDKNWRESQGLNHYFGDYDFEVVLIQAQAADDLLLRSHEHQMYARMRYWNAVGDLTVQLKRR